MSTDRKGNWMRWAIALGLLVSMPVGAKEFRVLEITQAQVDALNMRGRRTAATIAELVSPDGSHVAGTAAGIWFMWTADGGFNYPYFSRSYRIADVARNGTHTLLAGTSVDMKLEKYGIRARRASLIDETQPGGSQAGSPNLKSLQKRVEGKYVRLVPHRQRHVAGLYFKGMQATALSSSGDWTVGGIVLQTQDETQYFTRAFR